MASPAKEVAPDSASGPSGLEFLVVGNDTTVFKAVSTAVRKVNGRLNCAPSVSTASTYLSRRKVDGIILDMDTPGALELLQTIRSGGSNKGSVVFACMGVGPESQGVIRAGANFALHRPLVADKVANIFNVATGMMAAEKRRYYRHPLMVPVDLKSNGKELESTMCNLSEGGMAIWSLHYHSRGSKVEFSFELPAGGRIKGSGEVTWNGPDGLAGIRFNIMPDEVYSLLSRWVGHRYTKPAA
jgi:CheY-like chemotaxis protein